MNFVLCLLPAPKHCPVFCFFSFLSDRPQNGSGSIKQTPILWVGLDSLAGLFQSLAGGPGGSPARAQEEDNDDDYEAQAGVATATSSILTGVCFQVRTGEGWLANSLVHDIPHMDWSRKHIFHLGFWLVPACVFSHIPHAGYDRWISSASQGEVTSYVQDKMQWL